MKIPKENFKNIENWGKKEQRKCIACVNILVHFLPHFLKQSFVLFETSLIIFMHSFILWVFLLVSLLFFHAATWSFSITTLMANTTPSCRITAVGYLLIPVDDRAGKQTGLEPWCPNTLLLHFWVQDDSFSNEIDFAWRIPGTGEPGGLPSMGSHRVGHDWSDLAAAVAAAGFFYYYNQNLIRELTV